MGEDLNQGHQVDESRHSLQQAAGFLGVSPKTLKKWMKADGIDHVEDDKDKRKRPVRAYDVELLARKHRRALPVDVSPSRLSLESLAARVDDLERGLQLFREEISRLQGHPVEKLLRLMGGGAVDGLHILHRPPVDKIRAIIRGAIKTIDAAPYLLIPRSREIFITSQAETDLFDLVPALRQEWWRALQDAIARGWTIVHLIRQTNDSERMLALVEDVIQLLDSSPGNYVPCFLPQLAPDIAAREFVIVPGVGMLEMYSSEAQGYVDVAEHYVPGERFGHLLGLVTSWRDQSSSLITSYPALSVAFTQAIARVDGHEGERGLVMNGLSDLTVPFSLHEARADLLKRQGDLEKAEKAREILAWRKTRATAFEQQVVTWHFRDICPMRAINRYVQSGEYSPDDVFRALGCDALDGEQRKVHLEHVIWRLREFPNYELGLVDIRGIDLSIYQKFWLVKTGYSVLLEGRSSNLSDPTAEQDLEITEPRVVEAFARFFSEHLWDRLPPQHRSKQWVIEWLTRQMAEIPDTKSTT
jgi:hypothetical protein